MMNSHPIDTNPKLSESKTKISFGIDDVTSKLGCLEVSNCDLEGNQQSKTTAVDCTYQSISQNNNPGKKGILKSKEKSSTSENDKKITNDLQINTSSHLDCENQQVFKNRNELKKISNSSSKNSVEDVAPLFKVEDFFSQWYTIDTLRVIKGDDFVRQVLRENECTVSSVVAAVGAPDEDSTFQHTAFREKYIQLCRRLDLQDLEVSRY